MKRFRIQFLHFLIFCSFFFYPYFKFVTYHDYPIFSPEVITLPIFWVLVTFVFSCLFSARPTAYALVIVVLLFLFLATGAETIKPIGLWLRGILCLALFLFFWRAPKMCLPVIGLFVLGVILSDFVLAFWPSSQKNKLPEVEIRKTPVSPSKQTGVLPSQRHVLYLILDEHIGIDGMPPEVAETGHMRKKLTEFYLSNRFTLFPKAFSNYFYSDNSIANILNGTYSAVQDFYFPENRGDHKNLKKNTLFDFYHSRGYDIHVYQANYINYCAWETPVQKCYEYRKNSIKVLQDSPYSTGEKIWVIGSLFLETNSFFKEIEKRIKDFNLVKVRTGSLKVIPEVFEEIQKDIIRADHKTLFFAHLLFPHYPYIYNAECSLRPVREWENRNEFNEPHRKNTAEGYRRKYGLYYQQIDCLNRLLASLFDSLKSAGLYDSMTIVLHGDHGSRINLFHDPAYDYYERISSQDMITSHSTLLAVKKAFQNVGEMNQELGDITGILQTLLFGRREFQRESEPTVFLEQKHGKKELIRVPFPPF